MSTPPRRVDPFRQATRVRSAAVDPPSRFELGHQAVASRRGHGSVDMQRGEFGKVRVNPFVPLAGE